MKLEIDIPEEMLESEILDADDLIKAFEALDLMNALEGRIRND